MILLSVLGIKRDPLLAASAATTLFRSASLVVAVLGGIELPRTATATVDS
jgi:hypothetical protein